MNSKDIRRRFLNYFSERGHTIVPSSSLVPEKDPTLLFVNAGMVQFKNVFLGIETRPYKRATSCQKCVRAGGKHNDFENVGKTLRHHTFFEMLGNFSFGDYFKKEAIPYAWEFLTRVIGLNKERLWITVYKEDGEAEAIWKGIGIPEERIIPMGEKDNFWSMGDEGPCGPCSEIHYDMGKDTGCGRPECAVGCECDRFLEVWNLVFMEYDRQKDGHTKRLPHPSIDTGMGLERIACIMQGKKDNYETDLFRPIIRSIEDATGLIYKENPNLDIAMRVIADHVRGATFIINDGVLPSKDGRGYVLRRIIRRALRYGKKIGIEREFLYELSAAVVNVMEDTYPEIRQNHPYIANVLKAEEERFIETLNTGTNLYDEIRTRLKTSGSSVIPGDVAYRLYDTYGFPVDMTIEMAEEDGLIVDMAAFEQALNEQKQRSRSASKVRMEGPGRAYAALFKEGLKNRFVGYERLEADAVIKAIIRADELVDELKAKEEAEVFFDVTPFYAESGGQIDDEGVVESKEGRAIVFEVKKIKDNLFSHRLIVEEGLLKIGDVVRLKVNREKREGIARNHTATHLLQFALRSVLGEHVKQSGSLVEKDRLRFDFTHFQALDRAQLLKVEDIVNERIMGCFQVMVEERQREEAIKEGATALFEEKYGDVVRVVKIGDFSAELCGGTHVNNTGQIGSFYITGEHSLASGVRRIEAVTGRAAISYTRDLRATIDAISRAINVDRGRVSERVGQLLDELEGRNAEIARLKAEMIGYKIDHAIKAAPEKGGVKVISLFIEGATIDELRRAADIIRAKAKTCIAAVGSSSDGRGIMIVAITKDLQDRYNAGKMIRDLAGRFGGKGGGGPVLAQGGLPGDKVMDALNGIIDMLKVD